MKHRIQFSVNGEPYDLEVPSHYTLLRVLREQLVLTGTKNGCEAGECGACAVLMNGEPVNSCMVLAATVEGREVTTVEGIGTLENPHPLQTAITEHYGAQCGYCTPGMIMAAKGLLLKNPSPPESEIRQALAGNICRCTGYVNILKAVEALAQKGK